MPTPTFFLVGAPKCGTTALYTWLKAHPQICMSQPKEPQFFARDIFGHRRNVTEVDEYLRCFDCRITAKEFGEASTCYLASASAAEQIKGCNPRAKIIVMLRNPVDMMYSLHSERLFSNMEHIRDFRLAVDSLEPRVWKAGRFRGQPIIRPSYWEMARFSEQLYRYFQCFGREHVRVILYEDLLASANQVYQGTLDFLGLARQDAGDFAVINSNKRVRSPRVDSFVNSRRGNIRQAGKLFLPKSFIKWVSGAVNRWNTVNQPRSALHPEFRSRLVRQLEPDLKKLSAMIGRDLSAWCEHWRH